ncbi:hypothetical protein E2542_SST05411 [Spatholobus suberectus]|nr:hypothetical protein E2542_SST05411 [Spatholobus suberectus]
MTASQPQSANSQIGVLRLLEPGGCWRRGGGAQRFVEMRCQLTRDGPCRKNRDTVGVVVGGPVLCPDGSSRNSGTAVVQGSRSGEFARWRDVIRY